MDASLPQGRQGIYRCSVREEAQTFGVRRRVATQGQEDRQRGEGGIVAGGEGARPRACRAGAEPVGVRHRVPRPWRLHVRGCWHGHSGQPRSRAPGWRDAPAGTRQRRPGRGYQAGDGRHAGALPARNHGYPLGGRRRRRVHGHARPRSARRPRRNDGEAGRIRQRLGAHGHRRGQQAGDQHHPGQGSVSLPAGGAGDSQPTHHARVLRATL
mmetsp:Transcript_26107/g.60250  ORF Transcript_26107/g.60250 Transcript_26107/m.60250 type:complete len:212 (+) Transcript_26107:38-673(+)